MIALRFQIGGRHQTSPASLRGDFMVKAKMMIHVSLIDFELIEILVYGNRPNETPSMQKLTKMEEEEVQQLTRLTEQEKEGWGEEWERRWTVTRRSRRITRKWETTADFLIFFFTGETVDHIPA